MIVTRGIVEHKEFLSYYQVANGHSGYLYEAYLPNKQYYGLVMICDEGVVMGLTSTPCPITNPNYLFVSLKKGEQVTLEQP